MKEQLIALRAWPFEFPKSLGIRLSPKFWTYSPYIQINIETKNYSLKTASCMDELVEVFKLRHDIFLAHKKRSESYDIDEFDHLCDHIIIKDKETQKICGTYRIMSSENVESFYSQTEFMLQDFLTLEGSKVELGRACIHHGHRNGSVIDLLWKGISQYCEKVDAKFLFGCSSVHSQDLEAIKSLGRYIKDKGCYSDEYNIRSYGHFEVMEAELYNTSSKCTDEGKSFMPPLLKSYLNAGAKVYGTPAFDEDFGCFDLFTVLEMSHVSSSYKKRYFTYL